MIGRSSQLPIIARAGGHGRRTAVVEAQGTFTYNDLLDASSRVAAALLAGRLDLHEERVAFLVTPGFPWVAVQWGIWRAGGVAVPLPLNSTGPELQYFIDDTGAAATCCGAGSATLTASQGTPLVVRPPAVTRQHPFPHATAFVYADPAIWTWTCNANSDSTPLKATVRWELDPRQMPLGLKGFGHAPFTLSKHAKAFTVTAGDSCDSRQGGGVQKRLPQGSSLELLLVGNVKSGGGAMLLKLGKGFRLPNKNAEAIHVGVTLTQGSRTLVNSLLCTFAAYQWEVGKGYGVDCWQNP